MILLVFHRVPLALLVIALVFKSHFDKEGNTVGAFQDPDTRRSFLFSAFSIDIEATCFLRRVQRHTLSHASRPNIYGIPQVSLFKVLSSCDKKSLVAPSQVLTQQAAHTSGFMFVFAHELCSNYRLFVAIEMCLCWGGFFTFWDFL